jgi:hypothetical protein
LKRKGAESMEVEYDEDINTLTLRFPNGIFIGLPANHGTLGLWKFIGIPKYQKWLWEKQSRKCAECGKPLLKSRGAKVAYLHHDPPLGTEGSKAIDYKGTTKNRVLCYECHKKHHSSWKVRKGDKMDEIKLDYEGMYEQLSREKQSSKEIRNAVILSSTALEFAITQIVEIGAKKFHMRSLRKMLKQRFTPINIKLKALYSAELIDKALYENLLILFRIRNKFAHELFITAKDTSPAFIPLKDSNTDNDFLKGLPNDSVKFQLLVSKCFAELLCISKRLDPNSVLELEALSDFELMEE